MAPVVVVSVTVLVLLLAYLCLVMWLLHRRRDRTQARIAPDGTQEIEIVVRGRYQPDTVVVRKGVPVRLLFNRQENTTCSERVIFSVPHQERWLAPFATTTVQFVPTLEGEFLFTCAHGMYQGHLIVREPKPARLLAPLWRPPVLGFFLSRESDRGPQRHSEGDRSEDAAGSGR